MFGRPIAFTWVAPAAVAASLCGGYLASAVERMTARRRG
jgi:hypothetical protein